MLSTETINKIRKTIFGLLDFNYDGEISVIPFDGVKVDYSGKKAQIGCNSKTTLARGLFLFAKELSSRKTSIEITQTPHFEECGVLLDVNTPMTVDGLKSYMGHMAALGLNSLYLCMDSGFEVKEYPYYGYMQGRYTLDELHQIDDYAYELGIEVVPCIQTLGHLQQYLHWEEANGFKDTPSVLMVGEEKTYDFIETIIRTLKNALRTHRIHLAMDEAKDMGFGLYLKDHAFPDRVKMFNEHLARVKEICKKYELEPMVWSDMFFRLGGNGNSGEYDPSSHISKETVEAMQDVSLVYWEYYRNKKEAYDLILKKHLEFGAKTVFAGAVWTIDGYFANTQHTFNVMHPALQACLDNNIKSVVATIWGNASDTNHEQSLYGLSLFSEYNYLGYTCTDDEIHDVASYLTGFSRKFISALDEFHLGHYNSIKIGFRLICCDILYELLRFPIDFAKTMKRYESALDFIRSYDAGKHEKLKIYAEILFETAIIKCSIFMNLRTRYHQKDTLYLKDLAENIIPDLITKYEQIHKLHQEFWLASTKPFGIEEIQIRYAGIIARLSYAADKILSFANGDIACIEELEQEVLTSESADWLSARSHMYINV